MLADPPIFEAKQNLNNGVECSSRSSENHRSLSNLYPG
jgi:hypothetical protein